MKNLTQMRFRLANMERKWMLLISSVSCLSLLLLVLALALASTSSSSSSGASPFSLGGGAYAAAFFVLGGGGRRGADGGANSALFAETKAVAGRTWSSTSAVGTVPRLAYMISGSLGDGERLKRTLQALYHPRNAYVVHLDLEAPPRERLELATFIKNEATFRRFGNVHMISKANLVTYRGPTMVANTLHGAALLLRNSPDWDWFINLSASDYPLVSQDDLLHTFSFLPRDLNFLEHTSKIGWKEFHRARPIIIDPGLYMTKKSDVFWVTQKRAVPTAFKLFTGSAWMMLSRAFMEYCIWGWDNLPRQVLMYYANFLSSPEGYFHTVICNAQEFLNTTVNHDLHYISWDNPPKQHPHNLGLRDFQNMNDSNAPFARKFFRNDPVLDKIDLELLDRRNGSFVPGGWCVGNKDGGSDPCVVVGDASVIKPGKGSKRLQNLIAQLLSKERFRADQCK